MFRNHPVRFALILLAALAILDGVVWISLVTHRAAESVFELDFLDVGQGDSQLIRLPGNVKILIDGGPATGAVLHELAQVLPEGDRYLDLVIMTHPQLDHFGGLIDIFKRYEVGAFIANGRAGTAKAYADLVRSISNAHVGTVLVEAGDAIRYGGAVLSVLGPNRSDIGSKELNDTSVVALLDYRGFRALYTGDIGENIEEELVSLDIRAQVLKVGHHGSRFSSSAPFLAVVRPTVAVIEVGKNSYGHPTIAALDRLNVAKTRVFRTDRDGTVIIHPSDDLLRVFALGK